MKEITIKTEVIIHAGSGKNSRNQFEGGAGKRQYPAPYSSRLSCLI